MCSQNDSYVTLRVQTRTNQRSLRKKFERNNPHDDTVVVCSQFACIFKKYVTGGLLIGGQPGSNTRRG
eukprot:3897607-Amphidinium_carterae.1